MKSFQLNHHSNTRQSIGAFSRTESLESTILIRDLDSHSFTIQHKPVLSMMGRELNYGVLTQHTQQDYSFKMKSIQSQNKELKQRIILMQNEARKCIQQLQEQLRLKEITEAQYVSGIKSMYERNTQLNEKIIIYERQLKTALYKTCELQKQLQEMNIKAKNRTNKQHGIQNKIRQVEQKYHQKIISLQHCYEDDKTNADNYLREYRYQIQTLKSELEKQKNKRISLENTFESKKKIYAETEIEITRLKVFETQNKKLISEINLLKEHVNTLETQNKKEIARQVNKKDDITSSAIAALAIQNITLKQEQAKSSKNLTILEGKVKTYQNELYKSIHINKQNSTRQNYRKERFSSVDRQGYSCSINQQLSCYDINPHSMHLRPKKRQSQLMIRSQNRENMNGMLIRKCKELNQSLYI